MAVAYPVRPIAPQVRAALPQEVATGNGGTLAGAPRAAVGMWPDDVTGGLLTMVVDQPDLVGGRYRLMNRIGSGGMGQVWLAWDERLSRAVALKQLHAPVGLPDDEASSAHARAMREARITARLHHPNAVPVFDVVDDDGRPCLVMQYLPSRSLHDVISDRGRLPAREVARLGSEVASALAAAHEAGIVHRDVKPGNILLTEDGSARITDFGISRALGDATLTSTGMVTGTPAYLAPEVARGEASSPASDVFSLGATLYTATEGAPPFGTADNAMALLHRVASGVIRPPADSPVAPLLARMLARAPEDRPTMADVSRDLALVAAGPVAHEGLAPGERAPDPVRTRVLPVVGSDEAAPPGSTAAEPRREAAVAGAAATERDGPDETEEEAHGTAGAALVAAEPPDHGATTVVRRRSRTVLAALAILLLAGLGVVVWALQGDGDGPSGVAKGAPSASASASPSSSPTSSQPRETPSPSSSPVRTSSAGEPSPNTSRPAATSAPSTASRGTRPAALAGAVGDYYALLPGDIDGGWERLTARYQSTTAGNRETYEAFWDSVDSVEVRGAEGSAPDQATATIRYAFEDGRRFEERTSFRLVDDGGVLKIDRSSVLSSRQL
jgi:eukaryotic-like serine/threonine-protein kinase